MTSLKKKELYFPQVNSAWPSCPVGMEQITNPILLCVFSATYCCLLPSLQPALPLSGQSESYYELHDFSPDNRSRFLLPTLPFLLNAQPPGHTQKAVSLWILHFANAAVVFPFCFGEDDAAIHTVLRLLCAGNSMLACYLRLLGKHRSFVILLPSFFPAFGNIERLQSYYCSSLLLNQSWLLYAVWIHLTWKAIKTIEDCSEWDHIRLLYIYFPHYRSLFSALLSLSYLLKHLSALCFKDCKRAPRLPSHSRCSSTAALVWLIQLQLFTK